MQVLLRMVERLGTGNALGAGRGEFLAAEHDGDILDRWCHGGFAGKFLHVQQYSSSYTLFRTYQEEE